MGTALCKHLAEDGISGVVAGFTAKELLTALAVALVQFQKGKPFFVNCYPRVVKEEGSPEAQKLMGEASVLEMVLKALPEVVKNAAEPLAQTDKIVMYGDGNATRMVRDVMGSANQIMEALKEGSGIDIPKLLADITQPKAAEPTVITNEEE